jgi:hypothetical protein
MQEVKARHDEKEQNNQEDSIRLLCMSDIAQTLHNPQCREDVFNVLIKWSDKLCKK